MRVELFVASNIVEQKLDLILYRVPRREVFRPSRLEPFLLSGKTPGGHEVNLISTSNNQLWKENQTDVAMWQSIYDLLTKNVGSVIVVDGELTTTKEPVSQVLDF